jgi:hypothetical protein
MSRDISRFLISLAFGVALGCPSLGAQVPTPSLLGRWHGTSICIRASWNAACSDEEVFYDFVPAPSGLPWILPHAYKRVGTAIEAMGDMEFLPDTSGIRWIGEFANTRVHVRWVYQVTDSGLTGGVVLLPAMQLARNVRAQRDST